MGHHAKPLNPDLVKLGQHIKAAREETCMTQEALAFNACIDTTHLSGIERGARNPTFLVLHRLAHVLNRTVKDFAA